MPSQIQELANTVGFRGTPNNRIAEPSQIQTLPVIDNAVPTQSNIRTSVDCYVSGQYVTRNGKVTEVTQRYTIFVAYSKATQMQTMQQIRDRITSDFQAKYGKTFNVTNVYIPTIPVPKTQELEGIPKAQVMIFQMLALSRAARTTEIVIELGEATSWPMVLATATPKTKGPIKLATLAMIKAAVGVMAREEIMVATTLALS